MKEKVSPNWDISLQLMKDLRNTHLFSLPLLLQIFERKIVENDSFSIKHIAFSEKNACWKSIEQNQLILLKLRYVDLASVSTNLSS